MEAQVMTAVETNARPGTGAVLVEKRDGRVVDFDPINIISAVKSAFADLDKEVGPEEEKLVRGFADQVEGEIKERYNGPAKIEDIQNLVEHALIDAHLYDVARAYTNYRLDKDIQRAKATDVNEAVSRFINQDPTLIHENANKDANVYATQRDLLAGAVSKAAAFNMLPPAVANAHMKGDIHFHDADYSPFTAQSNCSLPNFWDMLANGFTLGNAPMASPKSIAIAATQITQIMKDVASSQYGGQTANRADEHLATYAKKDYEKFLEEARETIPDGMPVEFARRQVENAKKNEPSKLHFGSREPLPMDTPFHDDVDELEQEREILAKIRTRKSIYDAMQTMEYQINSNRVSNGQTPFVTIGFGLGTDWFAREVQRAILLNRIRGLGKDHHTAIFPKLVFTIRHGVNADPGDPNYDLKQLALECATKRMYPDVVFYENIVKITGSFKAPMGCRSFLQGWINPATGKDEEDGRMNLGVVSVNVPRIALESHGDKARFWKLFNERMETAHQALQFRIMRCKQATPVNAPTLFRFGAFGRLGANDNVDALFKNERATVSLGYIGLAEATAVFYGKNWIRDHGWDPQGKEFALSIVKRMNELCKQWSRMEGYHYSVYSTPAESLTDRFNRMDREKFGRVEGVTDHDFYTNSFHYPVWLQPTPMEKLNYEKDFPYYASGGFINYCEYPCLQDNPKALEAVWDYAYNIGIGYLGTNTPIDHCFVCGFQGDFEPTEEGFKCPECGNADPDKCNVTKRTCGYLGNPVQRPMVHGRHEEISHRVKHMSGETGHVTLSDGTEREWFEEAK
ncbi:anaerobic ribonucleoside-triphosphate reductase [Bifidobacterium scardovii]|uniref:Anaerobic ribonucleoside-triphosphate reductase n=4 Tax=Bifidobacterium scardovii TaxID=158787 RepID=A0A087DGL4_9BIFI|nr:anaerobic ribonucleoside-triphosphate reductase [Bifidobacterium scardovii]KFI94664.1 anaerobic ribonucleoside-triphosphate reductase [Bifidobacterium scardovii]MDK6350703.1 anaerobic ribonucleoside-triphosphate reductase [Bifidobacterium scardovii]MDU2421038.1 anaerobic ribonucleoside-triphosphate reductase [Bifidobacterium scardovii]MDU3736191.1 anaerobic ribonucleoside-triphosphate reductase [Bifidobacterium scardovii]MDU5297206.1 anaerobic ribonucleoside-triphosphate reductase [Bifidoba